MPMQSGSVGQYGATQYASQQADPSQAPTMVSARPQQATQASTYSTTPYSRPPAQPLRSAAAPATAAPAYGRPSMQAPAGNRAGAITRPGSQLAAAKPTVPAASAGKADLHRTLALSQRPPDGRVMAILLMRLSDQSPHLSSNINTSASGNHVLVKWALQAFKLSAGRMGPAAAKALPSNARIGRPAAVGQSAREIALLADSMRDKRDNSRGRERARDPDKDRAKERVTVVPPRGSASKERERDRCVSNSAFVDVQHAECNLHCP